MSLPRTGSQDIPGGWKIRLEEPLNRYYRYPIARWFVRSVLVKTPVTPNQISLFTLVFAGAAAYLVTFDDPWRLALAALLFELRSILDCADGTLARAKNLMSPTGHAIDAVADWIGVLFLYTGIFMHFRLHPPDPSAWGAQLSVNGVILLALCQGAVRSFASDYYRVKYCSIFEQGRDDTVEALRKKVLALGPRPSLFARVEVFIGKMGHLWFEYEWFDAYRSHSSAGEEHIKQLQREESAPLTRFVAFLWTISNGDFFLSMIVATLLLNQLWLGQVFFATAGVVWIASVVVINARYLRGAVRRFADAAINEHIGA